MGSETHRPHQQVWTSRYFRVGASWACAIPREIRNRLRLAPGDLFLMCVQGSLIIMRKVERSEVVSNQEINIEALPPAKLIG